MNARDDDKRIDFLSCFGLPLATKFIFSPYPSTSRLIIEGGQKQLRRILTRAGSGDAARAADAANEALASAGNSRLSQNAGRMVATLQNVFGFMCVEVALAAMNGDRLASCKWCRDVFLIGPRTNRRATAKFCKDLCRVKWNRAKST